MSHSILKAVAADRKTKIALVCNGASLSYSELNKWSDEIAVKLRGHSGAAIGILAPSSFEYVAATCGIWKVGAMAVPLQTQHPQAELEYIVRDSKLAAILTHPECLDQANLLATDNVEVIAVNYERNGASPVNICVAKEIDGALLVYTSGTTSRPKGVVITFGNLDFQIKTLQEAWGWNPEDRIVNILPLHRVHGIVNILYCSLASQATCELYPRFDASEVWSRLASGEISVFMAVPTIYSKLIQWWDTQPASVQTKLSSAVAKLRLMVSGSAALPLPLFEKWKQITNHSLLERYGMTEIGMAISNPYKGERKPKSVGLPLPGVNVRLSGNDEIEVKGPNVFREYLGKPDLTQESFTADGWFKTGDIARCDEEGYFYILGRASQDIIKCGGYKLSALEIESVLLEHPALSEVAVVGIADPEWGERVAAVCVWRDKTDHTQELRIWLKDRLSHYKVPSLWKTAESLPRNAMGKITKPAVRKLFETKH